MTSQANVVADAMLSDATPTKNCSNCMADAPGGAEGCWIVLEIPFGIGSDCFYRCSRGGTHYRFEDIGACPPRIYLEYG